MTTAQLGEIASIVRGISFPKDAKRGEPKEGYVACLRTTNVQRTVEWDDLWFVPEEHVKREEQFVHPGDILISTANSYELVGKVAPVIGTPYKATLGAFISLIRPGDRIDPKFLYHQLAWGKTQSRIRETASTTTNISNVSTKKLLALDFLVPGLDEQRRIVGEIEKQFSRLDEAVANLQRVKANLKRYKAAVLKAAVEGRLVETEAELARREGRTFETGEQLLQRILEERRAKWSGRGKYREPPVVESLGSSEVPNGWGWATIGSVCFLDSGEAFKKHDYSTAGLKLLQIANVGFGETDWEQQNYLPDSFGEKFAELLLQVGDIVLALNRPVIGRQLKIASVSSGDLPAILYQRVGRLRPVDAATAAYLFVFFQSQSMLASVRSRLQGTDQPYLNTSLVPEIPVSLPPLAEQVRIVSEVDRHLSIIREVEAEVDANLKRSQALRQATLAQAFSAGVLNG